MKKLALILALMIIPCSAFGLEMMNDSSMDGITGQAGVSIAVDDVQLFINIDKLAWIDCDGFNSTSMAGTCSGAPGAIGINNFQIDVLNINAIVTGSSSNLTSGAKVWDLKSVTCGQIGLFFNYADSTTGGCYLGSGAATQTKGLNNYIGMQDGALAAHPNGFRAQLLTIDATDALPAATEGLHQDVVGTANVTYGGVIIGLPTVEVYINSMSLTPYYTGDIGGTASKAVNNNANFGTIEMQGITFTVLSGRVEIAPH